MGCRRSVDGRVSWRPTKSCTTAGSPVLASHACTRTARTARQRPIGHVHLQRGHGRGRQPRPRDRRSPAGSARLVSGRPSRATRRRRLRRRCGRRCRRVPSPPRRPSPAGDRTRWHRRRRRSPARSPPWRRRRGFESRDMRGHEPGHRRHLVPPGSPAQSPPDPSVRGQLRHIGEGRCEWGTEPARLGRRRAAVAVRPPMSGHQPAELSERASVRAASDPAPPTGSACSSTRAVAAPASCAVSTEMISCSMPAAAADAPRRRSRRTRADQ